MKIAPIFFFVFLLFVQGDHSLSEAAHIDPGLQQMAESFLREASARNVNLSADAENLIVQFGSIEEKKGGSCRPNTSPMVITIDSLKWKFLDNDEKESLVFHELAHCLLLRPHNNEIFKFGECKSLLREDLSRCHLNWSNKQWRSYYLDELFAPDEASNPEWYASMPEFCEDETLSSGRLIKLDGSRFQYFDREDIQTVGHWAITVVAQRPETGYTHTELTLNEIILSISFTETNINSGRSLPVARLNIMEAATRKMLIETILPGDKLNLTLRRHSKVMYILLGKTLRYVLPINPASLRIGCYSTLPDDHYEITFYKLNGVCENGW